MGRIETQVEMLVDEFAGRRPLRTGSLVMTIFGDAIAPRGGALWLSSLIGLLRIFKLSERLVRTSVTRLAKDDWLLAEPIGRQSMYRLSPDGLDHLRTASERIYQGPRPRWDGKWHLVLLGGVQTQHRERLRRRLRRLGFGPLSTEVMAHPTLDWQSVERHFTNSDGWAGALMMTGSIDQTPQHSTLHAMVQSSWALDELNQRHAAFLGTFRPLYQTIKKVRRVSPKHAYQLRILMIHEYRKTMLRDPYLPETLLPPDWNGYAAYQLCRNIYARMAAASDEFISETALTPDGPLPPPDTAFFQRFDAAVPIQSRVGRTK
jgi:phenylacetic acid degradation operon negative regulatory protein